MLMNTNHQMKMLDAAINKIYNAYTPTPPPPKKINRPGTAPFGSEIPGSATGLDISATCYSHSGRS